MALCQKIALPRFNSFEYHSIIPSAILTICPDSIYNPLNSIDNIFPFHIFLEIQLIFFLSQDWDYKNHVIKIIIVSRIFLWLLILRHSPLCFISKSYAHSFSLYFILATKFRPFFFFIIPIRCYGYFSTIPVYFLRLKTIRVSLLLYGTKFCPGNRVLSLK